MEFLIENFSSRPDLENYIKATVGVNSEKNEKDGHTIKGTQKELKKFQLSDTCTIWGIKVVSSYGSTAKSLIEKLKKKGKEWKL